ncbi:MAG: MiaB/RimO family radical SAM methylthiotransferase [Lachnospiraceae bacterium]|nr:MiaB/RimO family radical SAM methylthiotransferase [Lachnospiraceae bacterium]
MKNVAFHNLGCKVNSYELDVVQQNFVKKGYQIVPFDQIADIYIVNTCSVTNIADRKSRQMLHQAKKRNPNALVVALGCYVQTGEEAVKLDECIDIAIGNNKKKDTVEIVEEYLKETEASDTERIYSKDVKEEEDREVHVKKIRMDIIDINHTDEYEEMELTKTGEHTRTYIKIQDGCNQFCSYCIIPFARGRVRSRQPEDICHEIKGLVSAGYREFVLTGIHISSYGVDFQDGELRKKLEGERPEDAPRYGKGTSLLLGLILKIHEIRGVERIRLGSLEPRIITEGFVKTISSLDKICPHFHLSLQSGCNETLKRMNRHYDTAEYAQGVERLRKYFDKPAITTDVIVGFPGETEEEFRTTKGFLEDIGFFEMHIFPYSVRKGTVAAEMKDQIDGEIKKIRSHELLELEKRQSAEYRRQFVGQEEAVLFEETKIIEGHSYEIGHTARYVKVAKETADDLSGQIITGEITGMLNDEILMMK